MDDILFGPYEQEVAITLDVLLKLAIQMVEDKLFKDWVARHFNKVFRSQHPGMPRCTFQSIGQGVSRHPLLYRPLWVWEAEYTAVGNAVSTHSLNKLENC